MKDNIAEKKKKKKIKPVKNSVTVPVPVTVPVEIKVSTPEKNELTIDNFNIMRMPNEDSDEKTNELQVSPRSLAKPVDFSPVYGQNVDFTY